ncbi:hypothetical protein LEMLEM_LOCUS4649 [Lemmus lemmus]
MWAPSRRSRAARPCEGRLPTQLWRNCCLISGGMWALCSPRRTSLRLGTRCWPIKCQLLPVLVPSPHVRSLCQPRTLVWGPRRPLFSRL